jgi:hypothetical protein
VTSFSPSKLPLTVFSICDAWKPFPPSLNVVSKKVTLTAVHWTTINGPLPADLKNLWSDQDTDQIKCLPYITPCHFQKFTFVKFLQLLWLQFQLVSLRQDEWKPFTVGGLKAKNKRTERYQLMQPLMMHALLHRKSYAQITVSTTECDLYSTYYDYYAPVIFTLHSME